MFTFDMKNKHSQPLKIFGLTFGVGLCLSVLAYFLLICLKAREPGFFAITILIAVFTGYLSSPGHNILLGASRLWPMDWIFITLGCCVFFYEIFPFQSIAILAVQYFSCFIFILSVAIFSRRGRFGRTGK